jgi:hypothetical protein
VWLGPSAAAQTQLLNAQLVGTSILVNPGQTYTSVYVVFPPQSGQNNADFVQYVMTQPAIDGVNLQVGWSQVETAAPSQMDCTQLSPPANSPDQCQPDPLVPGWFHTYNGWAAIDGTGCADTNSGSISQWFCDFPWGSNVFKKVAIQLFGISAGPSNADTPSYVTGSTWINAAAPSSYLFQDVVNTVNAFTGSSGCGGYSGSFSIPPGTMFSGDASVPPNVTVTLTSAQPLNMGDTIWLNPSFLPAHHASFDVTSAHGTTVAAVTTSPKITFTYAGSGTTGDSSSPASASSTTVVTAVQSWPVPYEAPYKAAYLSFLKAAIYHFNNLNLVSSTLHCTGGSSATCNRQQTTAQIAYLRPGVARGGEAIPICTTSATTPMSSTMPTYSESTWDNWYGTVNDTIQAANPQMQIMFSLNAGDPASANPVYSTNQAAKAVAHYNARGQINGFGSQGLQWSDQTNSGGTGTGFQVANCPNGSVPPDTANNWGCMFNKYWDGSNSTLYNPTSGDPAKPSTNPFELQQIDCSNPCTASSPPASCSTGTSADSCMQGGPPGETEDLRGLLPFTTQNYNSILELYNQDALLAFDPNFCTLSGSTCSTTSSVTFSGLSSPTQYGFFQYVGIGKGQSLTGTCYTAYGYLLTDIQSNASGDCTYAAALTAEHGYH